MVRIPYYHRVNTGSRFRSYDLGVMSPARFLCAMPVCLPIPTASYRLSTWKPFKFFYTIHYTLQLFHIDSIFYKSITYKQKKLYPLRVYIYRQSVSIGWPRSYEPRALASAPCRSQGSVLRPAWRFVSLKQTKWNISRRYVSIVWPRSYEPRALPLRHTG